MEDDEDLKYVTAESSRVMAQVDAMIPHPRIDDVLRRISVHSRIPGQTGITYYVLLPKPVEDELIKRGYRISVALTTRRGQQPETLITWKETT